MIEVKMHPEGKRKVILTVFSESEDIGVRTLINALANFIKHLVDENGISFEDVKIKPGDKREVL